MSAEFNVGIEVGCVNHIGGVINHVVPEMLQALHDGSHVELQGNGNVRLRFEDVFLDGLDRPPPLPLDKRADFCLVILEHFSQTS